MVAYVRLIKPWVMMSRPYEITEVIAERGRAWTLAIEPLEHEGLTFSAGQFAWLTVDTSPFGIREHPFSFASSAEHPERLEFTIKELGDFTSGVGDIPPETRVYLDGPYGTFGAECGEAPGHVMVAGGIGSSPMLSILRTMADQGATCPFIFFYGSVTWEDVIYREELEALQERLNLKVVHVLEKPPQGWEGETGFITSDVLERHLPENRTELIYLICGPVPMIELVEKSLANMGVPRRHVESERYEMA
jgi:predicted ferric reductase